MRKKLLFIICPIVIIIGVILGTYTYLFREPSCIVKGINLPPQSETVHSLRFTVSDVYYVKILGEKVIKSSLTYEDTIRYIEENNSEEQLENICFIPYGGMSDDYIYDSEEDSSFTKEEQDYYIKIKYVEEL